MRCAQLVSQVYAAVSNPCCPLWSHFKYTPLCVAYYWPLCANMTSCIKPEVHSISQRRQRRTEPRLSVTCTKIWRRSELQFRMFSAGQTNRTDTIFCCLIWGGVTSDVAVSSNCCKTHPQHTRLMALCPGLPRWAGTRKVKPIWILLEQETMRVSGFSWDICKSAPRCRQITTPAPHHSVLQAGLFPSCCPTNSVKALKAPTTHLK